MQTNAQRNRVDEKAEPQLKPRPTMKKSASQKRVRFTSSQMIYKQIWIPKKLRLSEHELFIPRVIPGSQPIDRQMSRAVLYSIP